MALQASAVATQHRIRMLSHDLIVMTQCRVNDFVRLFVAAEHVGADLGMAAFQFVVGGFANVVKQSTTSRQVSVQSQSFPRPGQK